MNLVLAFLAGVMTWAWIGRIAWRYVLKANVQSTGGEARERWVRNLSHDDFDNLRAAVHHEALRRGLDQL